MRANVARSRLTLPPKHNVCACISSHPPFSRDERIQQSHNSLLSSEKRKKRLPAGSNVRTRSSVARASMTRFAGRTCRQMPTNLPPFQPISPTRTSPNLFKTDKPCSQRSSRNPRNKSLLQRQPTIWIASPRMQTRPSTQTWLRSSTRFATYSAWLR